MTRNDFESIASSWQAIAADHAQVASRMAWYENDDDKAFATRCRETRARYQRRAKRAAFFARKFLILAIEA